MAEIDIIVNPYVKTSLFYAQISSNNKININSVESPQAQIEFMDGKADRAIEILNNIIKNNPKSFDLLLTKAEFSFLSGNDVEAEVTYITAFKLKANVKNFSVFLRLGNVFHRKKSWGDARAILAKACEMKPNSSIAWLGLGK